MFYLKPETGMTRDGSISLPKSIIFAALSMAGSCQWIPIDNKH
jgi:hypothetical protein